MHKAKAVIITCMDFRFQTSKRKYIKENDYINNADQIIVAGGSRDFICPIKQEFSNYVWTQLELSIKLHNPQKIIFVDHQDCGGYAQDGTIPKGLDKDEDKKMHVEKLKKLLLKVKKKYPQKKVEFVYLGLDGSIEKLNIRK